MTNKANKIFITGTDTGVGKTVLSWLLMKHLFEKGHSPYYVKPFQTGCIDPYDTDSDALFIYKNIDELKNMDPAKSVVNCYMTPKAPYFAARDEHKIVTTTGVEEFVSKKENDFSHLVLEGAGGPLVPINDKVLVIDFMKGLGVSTIVAARTGLGTINHTLQTIEIMKNRGIDVLGIVMIESSSSKTSPDMIEENIEAIEMFSGVNVLGVVKHISDFKSDLSHYTSIFDKLNL